MSAERPPTPPSPPTRRFHRIGPWRLSAAAAILIFGAALAGLLIFPPHLSDYVERAVVERTEKFFDGSVSVDDIDVSLFPRLRVDGQHLVLRRADQPQSEPALIELDRFTATTRYWSLVFGRVEHVNVDGLRITVPPDREDGEDDARAKPDDDQPADEPPAPESGGSRGFADTLVIDTIECANTILTIAPDEPGGTPQIFDIQQVRLDHFALDGPADYDATLVNPRPKGEIASRGRFGPWNSHAPRLTPLEGTYTMTRADMSVFNGISGTLDATGSFSGRLDAIQVTGTSTMPDFAVDAGRHPMRLDTSYDARVDGTTGNTYLDRVDATLGESAITAKGEVAGRPGVDGKRVRLDVHADDGRLQDFLFLVVPEPEPPIVGRIRLDHTMDLPPGDAPVFERIRLAGTFTVSQGRFTSDTVQQKVDELSRRGQGQPKNDEIDDVMSTFSGDFTMRDGVITLPRVSFAVSGASVRVGGSYTVPQSALDFTGHLRLTAPLSKTTTGFKSVLLKVVDPFFRRHGAGAEVPIKIGGTVHEPKFGLNLLGRD